MSVNALRAALEAVERSPESAEAWFGAGRALLAAGEYREAVMALQRSTRLDPNKGPAWRSLGEVAAYLGWVDEPIACFERATALEPRVVEGWILLGQARLAAGNLDGADKALNRAKMLAPGNATVLATRARVLLAKRDPTGAAAILRRLDHSDPYIALEWAQVCRALRQPQEAVQTTRKALDCSDGMLAVRLGHALGELHDQLGDYERAFIAFKGANDRRTATFDPAAWQATVADTLANSRSVAPKGDGPSQPQLALIVGTPRSGTSLLEQALSAHPEIVPGGELPLLPDAAAALESQTPVSEVRASLEGQICGLRGESRWLTDKLPSNAARIGLAESLLPGTVVVDVVRDPVDALWSCYRQCFGDGLAWSTRLDWMVEWYQGHQQLMTHWREVSKLPMVRVDYEELVRSPEPAIRRVLDALDLPFDARCLSPHKVQRVMATASARQVSEPIHDGWIGRSAPYEAFLPELVALRG